MGGILRDVTPTSSKEADRHQLRSTSTQLDLDQPSAMAQDDLYNLDFLSLVAKITQEIDNHTGLNDQTLAEFVIDLHDKSKTLADFKAQLKEVGADFPESFIENMDRLILTLHPKHNKENPAKANGKAMANGKDVLAEKDK